MAYSLERTDSLQITDTMHVKKNGKKIKADEVTVKKIPKKTEIFINMETYLQ